MSREELRLGRYVVYEAIASGGMASVHFGRMLGPVGFARTIAVKRLHPHLARDPEFVTMFLDEARLAARVQHPNVVSTIDVVEGEGELFIVMEYVRGESLSQLVGAARASKTPVPIPIAVGILVGALYGLHAAHDATTESGEPLKIVHRDVSPQNILVGADGISRVVDFGVAKAASRAQSTRDGALKGKLSYMSPEQIRRQRVDRKTDIYAAGVVLWEALAGKRLFTAESDGGVLEAILHSEIPPPSGIAELDAVVLRALARDPSERFETAEAFATALTRASPAASPPQIAEWVQRTGGDRLAKRAATIAAIEGSPAPRAPRPSDVPTQLLDANAQSQGSQVSGISVSSNVDRKPTRRALGVVVALAAFLGTAAVWTSGAFRSRPVATPSASSGAVAEPLTLPSQSGSGTVDPATARPPPTASEAPAPSSSSAPVPTVHAHVAAPKSNKSKDCNPNYVIDPTNGVKRFKPECL